MKLTRTKVKRIALGIATATLVAVPLLAAAQGPGGVTPDDPPRTVDLPAILNRVIDWMFGLLLLLGTIFGIAAAYIYLTAGGDTEKVGKARTLLTYMVIALALGFATVGISRIVEQLLGV
jgi:hypothetical protein